MNKEWNDLKETLTDKNDPFTYKNSAVLKVLMVRIKDDIDKALSGYIGQDK